VSFSVGVCVCDLLIFLQDRFVRLWSGSTGRRLGAGALRSQPTCVDVSKSGTAAVVGDAKGGVLLYSLEDGVERPAAT